MGSKGKLQDVRLFHASDVPIRRHTKIKGHVGGLASMPIRMTPHGSPTLKPAGACGWLTT